MTAFISWNTACELAGVPAEYAAGSASRRVRVLSRYNDLMREGGISPGQAQTKAKVLATEDALKEAGLTWSQWYDVTTTAVHYWFADNGIYASKCRTSGSFRLSPLGDDWKQQHADALATLQELEPLSGDDPVLLVTGGWMSRTLCVLGRISRAQAPTE